MSSNAISEPVRRPSSFPAWAVVSAAFVMAVAGAAYGREFHAELLTPNAGAVKAVRVEDLTGDGRKDVVAFSEGARGVVVSAFCPGADGAYPRSPTAVLDVSALGLSRLYYCCLAKPTLGRPFAVLLVDEKAGVVSERLVRDPKGWRFGKPVKICPAPPLPFPPDAKHVHVLDVGTRLASSAFDSLVLPSSDGYRVVSSTSGTKDGPNIRTEELPLPVDHTLTVGAHQFFQLHYFLPRLQPGDFDGDGRTDLLGVMGDELLVYRQTAKGAFEREVHRIPELSPGPGAQERARITMGDVNGDGRLDLLLTQSPSGGKVFDELTSQESYFPGPKLFSSPGGDGLVAPASSLRTSGVSVHPTLLDFDGDGDLDLLVTSLSFGLASRLQGKVDAQYLLFRFDAKKGAFERAPYFKVTRPFPMAQLARSSTEPVCFFRGDFDGDGNKDLLDIADDGHVTILGGGKSSAFLSSDLYSFDRTLFTAKARVDNDIVITRLGPDRADDFVGHDAAHVYVVRSAP